MSENAKISEKLSKRSSADHLRMVGVEDGVEADGWQFIRAKASSFHVIFERLLAVGTIHVPPRSRNRYTAEAI